MPKGLYFSFSRLHSGYCGVLNYSSCKMVRVCVCVLFFFFPLQASEVMWDAGLVWAKSSQHINVCVQAQTFIRARSRFGVLGVTFQELNFSMSCWLREITEWNNVYFLISGVI